MAAVLSPAWQLLRMELEHGEGGGILPRGLLLLSPSSPPSSSLLMK